MSDEKLKIPGKEAIEIVTKFSSKTSDIVRNLGLTGVAVCWLFLYQNKPTNYELKWAAPLILFLLSLIIDFLHAYLGTTVYGNSKKEGEHFIISERKINQLNGLFDFKTILLILGYSVLIAMIFCKLFSNPLLTVEGNVYNSETKNPVRATIICESLPKKEQIATAVTNPLNGEFMMEIPGNVNFSITVQKDSFFTRKELINIDSLSSINSKRLYKELYITKCETIFNTNDIFFETKKWEIRPEATPYLKQLAGFLLEHPRTVIEINAYADSIGTENDNIVLSQNRSMSIRSFLLSQQINPNRISTFSHGEANPKALNSTVDGRQQNRRVEIKILNK
ncbi:MAG: OmpA family protein [Nitrospira sp.]